MIRFWLNPHYTKKEKALLLDLFISYQLELYDEAECRNGVPKCKDCIYKNLCKDLDNSVQHLKRA